MGDTSLAGDYPTGASPYGALDVSGNVDEWLNDWYLEGYYSQSPYENPQGPPSGSGKVVRSGNFYYTAIGIHVAFRTWSSWPEYGNDGRGFRCAASAGE